MEAQGNPPQLNHNPWGWDHPPPPPPPPNFECRGPGFAAGDGFHHHNNHHIQNNPCLDFHNDHDFQGGADHQFHNFTAPPDDSTVGGGGGCFNPNLQRKRKFDCADGGNYAKLYVAGITRTVAEEEIRCMFEEHGHVVEVVLLNDKKTGQHQEYCFVKYASTEEADRAITALHNQFTFPGAVAPIKVKYASGERERLGMTPHDRFLSRPGLVQHDPSFSGSANGIAVHKVYVNGLNREASRQEILEIFSSYGDVADVYIMREKKQSRGVTGCGFVGFTHRYMAVAAINGLNGTYMMRGCDRPLIVRFADPKKPKNGELRPGTNSVDLRGTILPNISHLGILSASTQENTTNVQAGIFTPMANQLQCPSDEMQQPSCQQPFSPSRFSQMSLQQSQTLQVGSQSSRQENSQPPTPLHLNQTSNGNIEQQHDNQPPQLLRDVAVNSSEPSLPALCGSDLLEGPVVSDWSEHICPDGDKYYFNCVTCESRWEKPEEFALFEQQLQSQRLQPSQEPHLLAVSEASTEEECQTLEEQHQRQSDNFEKSQIPMSCAVEHSHEQVQMETSPLGEPAFVQ